MCWGLFLLVSLVAAACSPQDDGGGAEEGEAILTVAQAELARTVDFEKILAFEDTELVANVYDVIFDYEKTQSGDASLVTGNADDATGSLIDSWEISEDGRTWTLKIRDDMVSCAGNSLTSEDFQWTFDRHKGLEALGMFVLDVLHIESWNATDEKTFEFVTDKVVPPTLMYAMLASYWGLVFDSTEAKKHATDDDPWVAEWLNANDAGFGRYCIEERQPGVRDVLTANPNYPGEQPYFTRVVLNEVPESAQRLALLSRGEVQHAEQLRFTELEDVQSSEEAKVISVAESNFFVELALNNEVEPFDDVNVRTALAYAVPYDQINETVFSGFGSQPKSYVYPSYPGYTEEGWPFEYDPEEARRMLAEAGYADGFEVTAIVETARPFLVDTAVLLRDALEEVGVRMTIERLPAATFSTQLLEKEYEASVNTSYPVTMDPFYAPWIFYDDTQYYNWVQNKDDEKQRLITEGLLEPDPDRREQLLQQLQARLAEIVPSVYVMFPGTHLAFAEGIEGYTWYPDNQTRWHYLHE